MGKPSQASEAQLNDWVWSLASEGDIHLARPTKIGRRKLRDSGAAADRGSRGQPKQTKKRPREDTYKRDVTQLARTGTGPDNNSKRVRKNRRTTDDDDYVAAANVVSSEYDGSRDAVKASADRANEESRAKSFYSKELSDISRLIENVWHDVEPLSRGPSKHYCPKNPYAPGKLPAAAVSKRKLNLQPRKCDYGGIGLARPSLWIALDENGWRRKLNQNFLEHIPGFFGKQRSKAMKKQVDGDMLWRQRLAIRQSMVEKDIVT